MTRSVNSRSSAGVARSSAPRKNDKQTSLSSQMLDSPLIYVIAAALAISVFLDFGRGQQSIVNSSYMSVRAALIEFGEKGLRASLIDLINVDSQPVQWAIAVSAIVMNIIMLRYLWNWINDSQMDGLDQDSQRVPTAEETKAFTTRLTPEQYEFQKMEFTRKQLENLTGSDEFKLYE